MFTEASFFRKHLHALDINNTTYRVVFLHIIKNIQNLVFTSKKLRVIFIKDLKEKFSEKGWMKRCY